MTPQEKAKELVEKHLTAYDIEPIAVKSALISVEEIQKQFNQIKVSHIITGYISYKDFEENLTSIQDQLDSVMISKWNYWNEVKHEIEKL